MSDDNIISVKFDDLDHDIREQVIAHYQNDDYLVPDDWYAHIIDNIQERYKALTLVEKSITFDLYRNDFSWEGSIDFNHEDIKTILPPKFYEFDKESFFYGYSEKFNDDSMDRDYEVDPDVIESAIKDELFPYDFEPENASGQEGMDISIYADLIDEHIKKYNSFSDAIELLKRWKKVMATSKLLFQDVFYVDETECDELVEMVVDGTQNEVTDVIEKVYDILDVYISDIFDEFTSSITTEYEYYYTTEYAEQQLVDRTFDVEVDEEGNQISIDDLNGNW